MLVSPPAPKLDVFGHLARAKATPAELRGEGVFFGKGKCAVCHQAPYYTDNLLHNLKAERFYEPRMINHMMASADGPFKTFPLLDVTDSPPNLHYARQPTLANTWECSNLADQQTTSGPASQDSMKLLRHL